MKRPLRLLLGVAVGVLALLGSIWAAARLASYHPASYRGKSFDYWCGQLTNPAVADGQRAADVIETEIVPHLVNLITTDTNDSSLRLSVSEQLNNLPGIHVLYVPSAGRRTLALDQLTVLGPRAQAAIPPLCDLLRRQDEVLCGPAAAALIKLQAAPQTIFPLLTNCLVDARGNGRPEIADALGELGPQAKACAPMLVKLLPDRSSKDIIVAVRAALRKIDPETAVKEGIK